MGDTFADLFELDSAEEKRLKNLYQSTLSRLKNGQISKKDFDRDAVRARSFLKRRQDIINDLAKEAAKIQTAASQTTRFERVIASITPYVKQMHDDLVPKWQQDNKRRSATGTCLSDAERALQKICRHQLMTQDQDDIGDYEWRDRFDCVICGYHRAWREFEPARDRMKSNARRLIIHDYDFEKIRALRLKEIIRYFKTGVLV